jgi:transcriptional regulator with XRE-family HTH domain
MTSGAEPVTFGQVVAAERRKRGLSQKDLAAQVVKEDGTPISPQYLNDVERDRRNPPSEPLIEQIARVLGLAPEYLFFLAGQFPPQDRDGHYAEENVTAAFAAFRRALQRPRPAER